MSDIVDAVQVLLAFLVIHVLTFGLYYLYGVMAEEDLAGRPAEEPWLELNYRLCNNRGVRNHSTQLLMKLPSTTSGAAPERLTG